MKKVWSLVGLLAIAFPILAACGGAGKPTAAKEETEPTAAAETKPTEGITEVKIEAIADILRDTHVLFNGRSHSGPIRASLYFTGGVAAKAYRYGQVQITAARHNGGSGRDLETIQIAFSEGTFWADLSEFQVIDHAMVDVATEELAQPEDGFRVHISFFPIKGATQVASLAGTVTVQTIDRDQVVTIENLDSLHTTSGTRLEDPRPDAIGDVSVGFGDDVTLYVKGQALKATLWIWMWK